MPHTQLTVAANAPTTLANGTCIELPTAGAVAQWTPGPAGFRGVRAPAEEDTSLMFEAALAELKIRETETLHITLAPVRGAVAGASPDRLVIKPAPAADGTSVVLYQDEGGGLSWHLPDAYLPPQPGAANFRAAAPPPKFTINGRTAAARNVLRDSENRSRMRGPITKLGRKIFKIFVIPLLDPLIAGPLTNIVAAVEARHRRENIRAVDLQNYRSAVSEPFADWRSLLGKRSLLVVHGILSTTEGMLAKLPPSAMSDLLGKYEGRVLALDQLTLSMSPEDNARHFLETARAAGAPAGFEFDILCHSRGGIVARTLVERGATLVPANGCKFGRVLFVATPNSGSPLADPDHMVDMIDVFTNLISNFPDGPVTYSIEVILALVKLLVHGAEQNLPGLAAMGTQGYIANTLNASRERVSAAYSALTSNYVADPKRDNSFFAGSVGDRIMDRIFANGTVPVENDLVVPTAGVHAANGHPSFPISFRYEFGKEDRVWHTEFFARPETHRQMRRHFDIGEDQPPDVVSTPAPSTALATRRVRSGAGPRAVARNAEFAQQTPPAELRRNPALRFVDEIAVGASVDLTISLEEVGGNAGHAIALSLAAGQDNVTLEVLLNAPGFTVREPSNPRMVIGKTRIPEQETLVYGLTAEETGQPESRRKLRADFLLGNLVVGSVSCVTRIVAGAPAAAPATITPVTGGFPVMVPRTERENCDWLVIVDSDDDSCRPPFRIRLVSHIPGEEYAGKKAGSIFLDGEVSRYVQAFYDKSLGEIPDPRASDEAWDAWTRDFNATLDGLGKDLWNRLPTEFRREYFRLWDLGKAPRSILVHSDEMLLPWELVIPYDENHPQMQPLGAAHVIGRWRTGMEMRPSTQNLRARSFCVLNPKYAGNDELPWSVTEAEQIAGRYTKAEVFTPAKVDAVRQTLLVREALDLLHFTGHGVLDAENVNASSLLLEDRKLDAITLTGSRLFLKARPIVYLNACSVGRTGQAAGQSAGFATILLSSGGSGVVAPHWPINDQSAMEFSLSFYDKLSLGRSIGEALQELRSEQPNNLSVRAFTLFGDPWVRINLSDMI